MLVVFAAAIGFLLGGLMLVVFAAAIGFLLGGLDGAAWAVVILYSLFITIIMFGG